MAFAVTCPSCSSPCSVAEGTQGQVIDCPLCAKPFRVGATPPVKQTLLLPPALTPPSIPSLIGRYQVRQKLGGGSFGTVYRAYDPQLDREVALKLLKAEALSSPSAVERFRREAIAAAKMLHAHVVPVYDCGEHEGASYITSAFIDGKPLSRYIPRSGMEPRPAAKLTVQLLEALAYAHQRGVVHRDVKPANCLVGAKGHLYLTDFGLAGSLQEAPSRLTRLGAVLGTPAYMAPEQAAGATGQVGPHSDQYGAGVVLYEMLTGRLPFEGPTDLVLFNVIRTEPLQPTSLRPGIDPALEAICLKAMAKKPEDRFADAATFANALRGWLAASKAQASQQASAVQVISQVTIRPSGYVVCQRGGGTHATIGEALGAAPAGATILIRPGVYHESLTVDKAVSLLADGPIEKVVIESASAPCLQSVVEGVIVRGLTLRRPLEDRKGVAVRVQRGNLLLEGCDVSSESFACLEIRGAESNPLVRGCKIHGSKEAAGVLVTRQGRGTIEGCELFANKLAGLTIAEGADPRVYNCKVRHNEGAGVLVQKQGRGRVEGCEVFANAQCAVEIREEGNPTLRNCNFNDNGSGLLIHDQGRGRVEGCCVFANRRAGVEVRDGGDPVLHNCKIHDNEADGVLVGELGRGKFSGCWVFANRLAGVQIREGGEPTVQRCRITDNRVAAQIHRNGKGVIEDCDVRGNKLSTWELVTGSTPTLRENRE